MSTESRIIVMDVPENKHLAIPIAAFDLGDMTHESGWDDLFAKEVEYQVPSGHGWVSKDCFGERLKFCDLGRLIKWMEESGLQTVYRRIPPVLGMLKGFNEEEWERLEAVNFRY